MFISPAYAQGAISQPDQLTTFILPMALVFVVFYFFMIRPQSTKQKEAKKMLEALRRGDRVVTAGGILGTVQKTRDGSNEIEVEIAPNVRVTVLREMISSVVQPVAANDVKPPATPAKAS